VELKRSQRRRGFPIFPLAAVLFALVCLVCVGYGLHYLHNVLYDYELHQEKWVVSAALEQFEKGEYLKDFSGGFTAGEFEDEDVFAQFLTTRHEEAQKPFRTVYRGSNRYDIRSGDETLATFTVESDETQKSEYGFSRWQVGSLTVPYSVYGDFSFTAPAGCRVLLNGREVTERYIVSSSAIEGYADLPEEVATPGTDHYRVEGLFAPPQISCEMQDGTECFVITDYENHTATASLPVNAATKEEISKLATEASQKLANFISEDGKFDDLAPYLLRSPVYDKLRSFYNGWYIEHSSFAFENMVCENFVQYSANHISCETAFDYYVSQSYKTHHFPTRYAIYFVRHEDKWQIADLQIR